MADNIFPNRDKTLSQTDREQMLGHKAKVFWLYGLSGSGKSALAILAESELHATGKLAFVLDGDKLRAGLNKNLSFTSADREENIRRAAEAAKLICSAGAIVLACFVCPTRELRRMARDIIGKENFREVFVKCSYAECARRDVKGLYAKAEAGLIKNFTGKDAPFEEIEPDLPLAIVIDTEGNSIAQSTKSLLSFIKNELS